MRNERHEIAALKGEIRGLTRRMDQVELALGLEALPATALTITASPIEPTTEGTP